MRRPALKFAEFKLTALETSSSPTTSDVNAWRTGPSTALEIPSTNAKIQTCKIFTTSVNTSKPKIPADNPPAMFVQIKTFRLLNRSASAPPCKLKNIKGAN